jgi:hypothetical protein
MESCTTDLAAFLMGPGLRVAHRPDHGIAIDGANWLGQRRTTPSGYAVGLDRRAVGRRPAPALKEANDRDKAQRST